MLFQEGRAEEIPGTDYDVVFSNNVLHWCQDKDHVFQQIAKSLKEGGKFGYVIVKDFSIEEEFCTPAEMFAPEGRNHMIQMMPVPTSGELHNLASDNGFVTLHFKEHIHKWKFENFHKLIEFYMTHFTKVKREHFNTEAMKRHFGEGEIVLKIPYTTIILKKQH